jgi:hypothetical protein
LEPIPRDVVMGMNTDGRTYRPPPHRLFVLFVENDPPSVLDSKKPALVAGFLFVRSSAETAEMTGYPQRMQVAPADVLRAP